MKIFKLAIATVSILLGTLSSAYAAPQIANKIEIKGTIVNNALGVILTPAILNNTLNNVKVGNTIKDINQSGTITLKQVDSANSMSFSYNLIDRGHPSRFCTISGTVGADAEISVAAEDYGLHCCVEGVAHVLNAQSFYTVYVELDA